MMMFKTLFVASFLSISSFVFADNWKSDPSWHDGLVEKATYTATRVVYGKPRQYEAIFFTNKEQHDTKTWTKSDKSTETTEVFKHNQIEVIPTPNYDYKYTTTSHLTVADMTLTRLDMGSQEFCGTSFKQFLLQTTPRAGHQYSYFGFSYMPESGRVEKKVASQDNKIPVVAFNSLPVWLRDYDFEKMPTLKIALLPDQKNNKATSADPVIAEIKPNTISGRLTNSYQLDLVVDGKVTGTFLFAKDRQHVMTSYKSADGQQSYELTTQERVNYWTIKGER